MRLGTKSFPLGQATYVMGVINMSRESRNVWTVANTPQEALEMAVRYRDAGASIIDLGGQSSHYESPTIGVEEELARVLPALEVLVGEGFLVSVDTWQPEVAERALSSGAVMVNDTGGLQDPRMREVIASHQAAAVMMYLEGQNPHEVSEIRFSEHKAEAISTWFEERLPPLIGAGIREVVLDPGIAINYRGDYLTYTLMQLEVIRRLEAIKRLGFPVLVPIPRKAEDHRVVAYITLAVEFGADLLRTHDVEWACDLVRLLGREPDTGEGP